MCGWSYSVGQELQLAPLLFDLLRDVWRPLHLDGFGGDNVAGIFNHNRAVGEENG